MQLVRSPRSRARWLFVGIAAALAAFQFAVLASLAVSYAGSGRHGSDWSATIPWILTLACGIGVGVAWRRLPSPWRHVAALAAVSLQASVFFWITYGSFAVSLENEGIPTSATMFRIVFATGLVGGILVAAAAIVALWLLIRLAWSPPRV